MHALFLKLAAWLVQKLAGAALIVVLALAGYGLWLFVQEEGLLETARMAKLQQTIVERDQLLVAKAAMERRIEDVYGEIERQKTRLKQAEKIVASLRELERWWESWWPWSERRPQQLANTERLKKLEELKSEATGKWAELQRGLADVSGQKDAIERAVSRAEAEIGRLEASRSRVRHYVLLAWDRTKGWVIAALAGYFLGPTLWSLTLYYALGPLLARGAPIRLGPEPAALPEIGESHVSIEATLRPGDVLRIKEKFLQASDEGIEKRTRFVLDWQIPLTSIACGLVEMVEMGNAREAGDYRVTLSNSDDPHLELAQITVPAGGSLVLRPRFLAGVIEERGERLAIRRHWRFLHWQAWISGQFRFFEFMGPCRLVVAGSRGVRAERLGDREGQSASARRTNQDATIGFTPNLEYRPVRAETFWSYYRGMNPLFDDLFAGSGVFVLQETAAEGRAATAGRFWSSVWNGVLKVFGL